MRNLPILILCLFFLFGAQLLAQDATTQAARRSCFTVTVTPDRGTHSVYVFTGDAEEEKVDLVKVERVLGEASTKWEKKPADKNCLSPNPNDCLVWCLVEVPAQRDLYYVLTDTSQTSNYQRKVMEGDFMLSDGTRATGYLQQIEVICPDLVDAAFIAQLQAALRKAGYESGSDLIKITKKLQRVLETYQADHDLPVGLLDVQTLMALGIWK
jgi:hypothetical protein